ncbi:MAG: transglutaminase-like domain-containing protein [Nitrospirota bacterium]
MPFNWEGDFIIQNSVIEHKRFVIGDESKQIRTDIREWISFEDNTIMKGVINKLISEKGLPTAKNPGDFDRRTSIIWDSVAKNIEYVHDTERQRKEDFWLFPPEILTLQKGDCEDSSFLLASLLIAAGISPFCVRVALGEVFDENGNSLGGHCWPLYKNETGKWCILESTLDTVPSRMPEADELSKPGQFFQYVPYYCFNNCHLWQILPPEETPSSGIEKYLRLRGKKVNLKKTRLPSGGWLSRMTGDWEPGHMEITGSVLRTFGFHDDAVDIAGDAAQDPDFYDWHRPSAHAQTNNDDDGRTNEPREIAIENYLSWMKGLHERLLSSSRKSVRHGLFYLGYALHGIQDLATHKGITNAQHSYMSKILGKKTTPIMTNTTGKKQPFTLRSIWNS